MAVPIVSGALRGWTQRRLVRIVTKSVVNHIVQQLAEDIIMDIMVQPLQPEKVRRKPEEQRSWKWFEIVTKRANRLLKVDDQISVNGISYRIDSIQNWDEGGYRRYEATEDYAGNDPQEYTT